MLNVTAILLTIMLGGVLGICIMFAVSVVSSSPARKEWAGNWALSLWLVSLAAACGMLFQLVLSLFIQ